MNKAESHAEKPCATCGTCPTCGSRPGVRVITYPVYPGTTPYVYPYQQPYWWGSTSGSATITGHSVGSATSSTVQQLSPDQYTYTN